MARHETYLLGDGANGEVRISTQPSAIPNNAVEFPVFVDSYIYPSDEAMDTFSDVIPTGKYLHLLTARATIQPVYGSYAKIELYWVETINDEDIYYKAGKTYLNGYTVECETEFPASNMTLTGHQMIGDEDKNARFCIRRTVFDNGDDNSVDVFAMMRGYYV